jgi:nicotinate-nucleotide adenylyltransferase
MKIGVFGGAFNPIHIGHLVAIEEVREKLKLDKVLFIPAFKPPHKNNLVSYKHRRNMVALAIRNNNCFELSEVEKEKGGISWTIVTLKELHKKYPKDKLYLIIGSDQYLVLNTWKEPENLIRYAKLIVMLRPGSKCNFDKSKFVITVEITQVDVASKEIRGRIKQRKSVRYKVVEEVHKYTKKNKLYT